MSSGIGYATATMINSFDKTSGALLVVAVFSDSPRWSPCLTVSCALTTI